MPAYRGCAAGIQAMNDYESTWTNLKAWLDTQTDYIVIPVGMVKSRMNEEEDLYRLGE